MLNLLAPGALFGLLALAVPAVLHLRRPPPPTVLVGTLRHLEALPRRRPRWWRWRDRARLALRLALLALLTLALACPLWRRSADPAPRRWSLVDPAGVLEGASRQRLEARRAAGDEVLSLGPEGSTVDLWSRLREFDARLPAGSSLTVFSPARLDELRGERPTLGNVAVDWVEIPVANSSTRPGRAASGVREFAPALSAPAGGGDEQSGSKPPRSETDFRVLILHALDRAEDAARLAAAVRMATPPGTVVNVNPGPEVHATAPDWVFRLGGSPPEAAGVRAARNLFTDAGEAPVAEDGGPPGLLVAPELAGGPDLRLRRRVALVNDPAAAVLWTDGPGRPVLTVSPPDAAGQRRWQFGSRFDPAWNDLAGTTALAEALRTWFFPPAADTPDPRPAGAEQARPRPGVPGTRPAWPWPEANDSRDGVDLRPWALALATLGFLLERVWPLRQPAVNAAR